MKGMVSVLLGCLCALLLLVQSTLAAQGGHTHKQIRLFEVNDKFELECKQKTGEWGPAPTCIETGSPLQLFFGVDGFQRCGWHIDSVEKYLQFSRYVNGEEHLACRVPMVPDHEFYIPFTIPLWGVVEADHTHVGSHLNLVFHAEDGKVTGVAAYPVLDAFQFIAPGSIFQIHGPIKWFKGHSFQDVSGRGVQLLLGGGETGAVVVWILMTTSFTMLTGVLVYRYFLKPRLIKKYLKKD